MLLQQQVGLKPDVISFTTAISALGSSSTNNSIVNNGDPRAATATVASSEEAVAIFREMSAAGVPPNVITHNSVMAVCVAAGQWEKALEIFAEVRDDHSSRLLGTGDSCSFNTALSACEVS